MTTPELRAAKWAATSNTGASSKAMLSVMLGERPKTSFCYPHDGSDLGRCIGLLDAVPEYRERLAEMKVIGPEWAALIDCWPELEARWRRKDDKLYERMKQILDPIEAKNRNLVKVGKHGAIHFGR
jgi:hypothetical protein